MKAYKLLDQDMTSYQGHKWEIGIKQIIDIPGNTMCSNKIFHCYNHPMLAVLFNPIHANIKNARLFEIEVESFVNNDGLKYASKEQTIVSEIALPTITLIQKLEFAIRIAKLVTKDIDWNKWADNWLSGKDRSGRAANDAYVAAYVAAYAATYTAYVAAYTAYAVYTADAVYVAYTADAVAAYAAYAHADKSVFNLEMINIIENIIQSPI